MRNGLAVRSEEQTKKVPKIFPTNEIARNKICSADLLNGPEWRKVGCVVENKLEFRQYIFVVRTYKLDRNDGKSFLRRGQAKVLFKTDTLLLNIESKRGFPLRILTIVSYLYVYISNTASGPRNKS
jgi:hypothetical protein